MDNNNNSEQKVQKMTDFVNENYPDPIEEGKSGIEEADIDIDETIDLSDISDKAKESKNGFFSKRQGRKEARPAPNIKTTAASRTYSEIMQERQEKESPPKKKKGRIFNRFIAIYSGILLLILIIGSIVFYAFLYTLEKSQPYNTAQEVTEEFNSGSESLKEYLIANAEVTSSLETDTEAVIEYYIESINADDSTFSYVENSSYTETAPSYDITLDGDTVAQITLAATGKKAFGLKKWGVSEINIGDYITDTLEYDIVVPTGAAVTVNGVELDDSYLTAEDEIPEVLANVYDAELISDPPTYDTYHITGLINTPEIEASDTGGTVLSLSLSDTTYTAGGEASDSFIESVYDRVYAAIESWGTYFINKSYTLSRYMLSGTEWYEYIFGSEDVDPIYVAFYGSSKIESYEFTELSAENYIQYTDDCFTVDVKYDMELTFNVEGYSDDNQNLYATWVWVKSDDVWYIADVIYLDDSEDDADTDSGSDSDDED